MYEINYTNINDISEDEVSATEVAESESNNTTEIELLTEIRDIEKAQLGYISFFVVIVLGGCVVYKLLQFFKELFW